MGNLQAISLIDSDASQLDGRLESYGVLTEHGLKISRFCYRNQSLLIIRAPGAETVKYRRENPCGWSDDIAPKPAYMKEKTKGKLTKSGYYSDYDILSFWKISIGGAERLVTGNRKAENPGKDVPPANANKVAAEYIIEAPIALFNLIASTGITDFQHGANDEYVDANGKPLNPLKNEKFVAFEHNGLIQLIPDTGAMRRYYEKRDLPWIY